MLNNTVVVSNQALGKYDQYLYYSDSRLHIYAKFNSRFGYSARISENDVTVQLSGAVNRTDEYSEFAQGVVLRYERKTSKVVITTDRLGTETLYFQCEETNYMISNRLESFRGAEKHIDRASVYQYFIGGYTVGESTLIRNVHQTRCHQIITIDNSPHGYRWQENRKPWIESPETGESIDEVNSRLSKQLHGTVLMASAGWDSRTLLCDVEGLSVKALTHGDASSREIGITKQLTGDLRLDHLFLDTRNNPICADTLQNMVNSIGSAVFPAWYVSCQKIQKLWDRPISSGIYGELMGGHYGVDTLLGSRTRTSSLLKFVVPGYKTQITFDEFMVKMTPSTDLWYLSEEFKQAVFSSTAEYLERVKDEISHYQQSDLDLSVERFMTEHRARQYILKQAHCAKNSVGYILPFADDELTNQVLNIPFNQRVHNKLNKKVLQRVNPRLLNYPTAAILCNASRPVVVQEFSRAARLAVEKITGKNNYGWFNYDFLMESSFFDDVIETLTSSAWDKAAMRDKINDIKVSGNVTVLGYALDTVCKVKTVDHLIEGCSE